MKIQNLFVINGFTSNPIWVVRGLGRNFPQIKIHLISCEKTFVNCSKYVHFNHVVPDWNAYPDEFAESIFALLNAWDDAIVIPTDDNSALVFSQYKNAWKEKNIHVLVADHELVRTLVNKNLFQKKMAALGVPTLDSLDLNNHQEIRDCLNSGLQLFVKPADSRVRKDYLILKSMEDYTRKQFADLEMDQYICQKWIGGHRIYMLYVFIGAGGNIACCGYDKIRQFPPHAGSGTFVITRRRKELIELSVAALKSLHYEGFAEFEYKYDEADATWYLLEINPRTTTQSRVSNGTVVDVEVFAVESVARDLKGMVHTQFREGLKWMLEIDDFLCFLYRWKDGTITFGEWRNSLRNVDNFGIWATDDAKASLVHYWHWVSSTERWSRLMARRSPTP